MKRRITWTEMNENAPDEELRAAYYAQDNRTDEQIQDDVHSEVISNLAGGKWEDGKE